MRLSPGGPRARWSFRGLENARGPEGALRFSFRVRHPRRKPLQNNLPLRVTIRSGGEILAERELTVSLRREFTLPIGPIESESVDVVCAVTGGHNFMETDLAGCCLVRGESGPVTALVIAAVSSIPLLWLILALCLLFSAFVQETTAFLAGSVLLLVILSGPALQKDFALIAAGAPGGGHSHGHAHGACQGERCDHDEPAAPVVRFLARSAGRVLSLFPDLGSGGAADPLSRNECPSMRDVGPCWTGGWLHLVLLLAAGCALFSWRRP